MVQNRHDSAAAMNAQQILAQGAGYFIGFAIVAVIMLLQRRMWVRRAHKLAVQADIALPEALTGRVVRYLRREGLLWQFLSVGGVVLGGIGVAISGTPPNAARSVPPLLACVPLFWIAAGLAMSRWPQWSAPGEPRVSRPRGPAVRRAFTPAEFVAVEAGLVLSAALEAWGLWYVSASALWWLACAIALAGAFAIGRRAAARAMNRAPGLGDAIETGWDDVLRFRRVRAATVNAVWGTAAFAYLLDGWASSAFVAKTPIPGGESYTLVWWPILASVIAIVVLWRVFRQGRRLWRQAWPDRDA
jgi:hypothetical protein